MRGAERLGVNTLLRPARENQLANSGQPRVTLLVESPADARLWRMHLQEDVFIRSMGGREQAIRELESEHARQTDMVVAVLDADLDRLNSTLKEVAGLIYTDAHDLETTILGTLALEKVVDSFAREAKLQAERAVWSEPLRERLFRHGDGMGRLRWLKSTGRVELNEILWTKGGQHKLRRFDGYEDCVDEDWAPSVKRCFEKVADWNNLSRLRWEAEPICEACVALGAAPVEQVCNGHDLLGFLLVWLKSSSTSAPKSEDELRSYLYFSIEKPWIEALEMWRSLRAWEGARPGRRLFR